MFVAIFLPQAFANDPTTQPLSKTDQRLIDDVKWATTAAEKVRAVSVIALKHDPRFLDTLIIRARDDSIAVQRWAVRGLGLISDERATYELAALASDKTLNAEVRIKACEQLAFVAGRTGSEDAVESLMLLSGAPDDTSRDPIAQRAKAQTDSLFKDLKPESVDALCSAGSDELRARACAERDRRAAGGESRAGRSNNGDKVVASNVPSRSSSETSAAKAASGKIPEGFTEADVQTLQRYAAARRKELSEQIARARNALKGPSFFGTSRASTRDLISTLGRERSMLTNSDPAKIGVALEWAGITAANRAGVASAAVQGYSLIQDVNPVEKTRRYYSDGRVEEGYEAGDVLGNLFFDMASSMSQADARAAMRTYKENKATFGSLSRGAQEKIEELRLKIEKNLRRR
jgi:hypothetical protein